VCVCACACKGADNTHADTMQYRRLESLTAVLLKIQVFCDVILCSCGYAATVTSQNAALLEGIFRDL